MKSILRRSPGDHLLGVFIFVCFFLLLLFCLVPFAHILAVSFSQSTPILNGEVLLFPKGIDFTSYKAILTNQTFLRAMLNSIIYTLSGTLINLIMSCLCAYPLTKTFPGKRWIQYLIIFTMFFSGGMIPSYLLIVQMRLINTIWAVILPGAISVYNMFIIRTFFQSIDVALEEAALIEGCSEAGVFLRIVLPLSKPVLITMCLFYGLGHWNSYFGPMIYLHDKAMQPLQVFLKNLLVEAESLSALDENIFLTYRALNMTQFRYAAIIVSTIPILLFYPYMQRHFKTGMMLGSLKG